MTALGKYEDRGSVGAQGWLDVGFQRKFSLRAFNEFNDRAIGCRLGNVLGARRDFF